MDTFNSKRFYITLRDSLQAEIRKHPDRYAYGIERADEVAKGLVIGFQVGGASKVGPAVKNTCAALGIPHTYAAIFEFLQKDFRLVRSTEDQNAWSVVGPDDRVYVPGESFGVADAVLSALRSGATGCSEFDEVASQILESVK